MASYHREKQGKRAKTVKGDIKTKICFFRVSESERELLKKKAKELDLTVSLYIRKKLGIEK